MDGRLPPSAKHGFRVFVAVTFVGVICYVFFFFYQTSLLSTFGSKMSSQVDWNWFRRLEIREGTEMYRRLRESNETVIILVWSMPGWMKNPPVVWHPDCGKCKVTANKSLINNPATKAVVFHYASISEKSMPPQDQRKPDQLHIVWTKEPPPNIRYAPKAVSSPYQFNGTMSYRRSSDFLSSYRCNYPGQAAARNISSQNILKMKTKGGVAVVSNCGKNPGSTMRIKILKKIQSLGFPLDGYGGCFPSSEIVQRGWRAGFHTRKYKFYFSFENAYHCRDYITEKVFLNAFWYATAVPVVFGATKQDYESLLPKGSYILAEDFASLERLVDYLQYLMKNDTAYLEYFRWHKTEPLLPQNPEPKGGPHAGFCQLCRALHGVNIDDMHDPNYDRLNQKRPLFSDGIAKRTIKSFRSYLFDDENKECNENNITKWKIYRAWKLDE